MKYQLLRLPRAIRQLRHLRRTHHPKVGDIIDAIETLATDPRPPQSEKLTNRPERRIRVGDYRLLYPVGDLIRTVTLTAIAHRREVYR